MCQESHYSARDVQRVGVSSRAKTAGGRRHISRPATAQAFPVVALEPRGQVEFSIVHEERPEECSGGQRKVERRSTWMALSRAMHEDVAPGRY